MASLSEIYLHDRGGSPSEYHYNLSQGQRIGQAFFNALSGKDQERIQGTIKDPFYFDSAMGALKVEQAIEWLLSTEDDPNNLLKDHQ